MADYYSILKKTIDGLPRNTPELRQAVYQKARTAIANQLRSMNPPPAESAVNAQLQLLEEAIVVVDSEYAAPPPADPVSPPAPQAPEPDQPQEPAPAPDYSEPPEVSAADPMVEAAPEEPPAPPAPPPQPAAPPESSGPPTVGMVPPAGSPAPQAPPASVSVTPELDRSMPPQGEDFPSRRKRRKGGLVGKLVAALVVVVLLLGSGYALWLNRDALQPLVASVFPNDNASIESGDSSLSSDEQAINDDTAAQSEKESVKLGPDGRDAVVEPVEPEDSSSEPAQEPLEQTGGQQDTGIESAANPVDEATGADTQAPVEQQLPFGEVAYLYEEGSAGSGATRTNAAVAWDTRQESLADGLLPEPVIVGKMEVPEKDLSVDIEIKRNVDDALSASHIIEVRFDVPDGFSGSSIDNIARFVMKSSEEARGEPLVAVPVKVSDGFFLIALDNLQQAVDVNTRLMLESSWIDIPVSYATGKRALITLEKGGTGERVFASAFEDWKNR